MNILLADDDEADCLLFKEALEELPVTVNLTIVHDGDELMNELVKEASKLPDILFLDLNMPRKNGFASLGAIKRSTDLQNLPVVIFSTASAQEVVRNVFRDAAHYYICKPADFSKLKRVIYEALALIAEHGHSLPGMEHFMITGDSVIIPEKSGTVTLN